jgi:Ala-tRNA(Pro) deacylase
MDQIYHTLKDLNIQYQQHSHPAVYTSAEAAEYYKDFPGAKVKSLFLRNRKGTQHYLVVLTDQKQADLKLLSKILGESQVGFASPERLWKYLQVKPGSVSPLGLVFDTEKHVKVVLDEAIMEHDLINVHPNLNTETITMPVVDLKRYLDHTGQAYQTLPF